MVLQYCKDQKCDYTNTKGSLLRDLENAFIRKLIMFDEFQEHTTKNYDFHSSGVNVIVLNFKKEV